MKVFDFVLIPARKLLISPVGHICFSKVLHVVIGSILEESVIMEASAKHDFVSTAEDELAFKKGSILKVNGSQKCLMLP